MNTNFFVKTFEETMFWGKKLIYHLIKDDDTDDDIDVNDEYVYLVIKIHAKFD